MISQRAISSPCVLICVYPIDPHHISSYLGVSTTFAPPTDGIDDMDIVLFGSGVGRPPFQTGTNQIIFGLV